MDFEHLRESLRNEIKPIYIINGGESFLTTTALRFIEDSLNLTLPEFNKSVIPDDYEGSAKDIIASAQALPINDSKRLLIINDYLGKKNESEKKMFLNYFKNPNPDCCVVFFSTILSDFFTSLEGKIEKINCENVSKPFLIRWMKGKIQKYNLFIEENNIEKIANYCNYSITKINTELLKLFTIKESASDRTITSDDIDNYITKDMEYIIFDLTNALTSKNSEKAYLIIDAMLKNKEQPINIISTITNHFRRLFYISRSSFNNKELSEYLGIKEYAIKKYREQLRFFSQRELMNIFDICKQTEFMIKSGKMYAQNAVSFLISSIINI